MIPVGCLVVTVGNIAGILDVIHAEDYRIGMVLITGQRTSI